MQAQESADINALTLDLLNDLELQDVRFLKTSAERNDRAADSEESTNYQADFSVAVDFHEDGNAMRVGATVRIELELGDVEVTVALHYVGGEEAQLDGLPSEVLENFVNKVAFMAAFPYLRAEVTSLTSKVFGSPLTMPTISQGEIVASRAD